MSLLLSALLVGAAPGPKGMTVRWFPAHETTATATVVRIDPNGTHESPVHIDHPAASDSAAGFNELGDVRLAIANGHAWVDSTAVRGTQYQYEVTLSDGETGTSTLSPPAGASPDLSRYRVASIEASGGDRFVHLTMRSSLGRGNFAIYRSTGGAFSRVAIALATTNPASYNDPAPVGTAVAYRVSVIDLFGNEGPQSTTVHATASDLHPPSPPLHLHSQATANAIVLSWDASTDPLASGYVVLRKTPGRKPAQIAQLGADARTYSDRVTPGMFYLYDVRTRSRYNVIGTTAGGASAMVAKTTPPDAPLGLRAQVKDGALNLTWRASHDPTTHRYEVFVRADAKNKPLLLAQLPTTTLAYNVSLPPGSTTAYTYGVGAQDGFGNKAAPTIWVAARLAQPSPSPSPRAKPKAPAAIVLPVAPQPRATMLADGITVQLDWAPISGALGYQIVRRNANGTFSTIAPYVRALSYHDVLAPGSTGTFSYALRVITRSGEGPTGAETSIHAQAHANLHPNR